MNNKTAAIYGIGNALVDLQVQVDDDFLKTLDVPKGQMLLVDEDQQEKVLSALGNHKVNKCSGGSAANTIVGIAELGGTASYCGKVASDALGTFYSNDLEKVGVELFNENSTGQTGTSLVMITPDAERTMMTHLGVSATLNSDDINPESIKGAEYVYIEGYLFTGESSTEAAMKTIDIAKAAGVKVALTASDPFVINMCKGLFWQLIEGPVDLLFCNEQEAQALTGLDDAIACANEIHKHCENVVITLGEKGSIIMHENELIPIEGKEVTAIDTTGAGDMYAAGILYGITNGLSWKHSGHLASHAAAQVVSQLGARLPKKFSQEEIAALLQ